MMHVMVILTVWCCLELDVIGTKIEVDITFKYDGRNSGCKAV